MEERDNREEDHSEINKKKEYQKQFFFSKEEKGEELQCVRRGGIP